MPLNSATVSFMVVALTVHRELLEYWTSLTYAHTTAFTRAGGQWCTAAYAVAYRSLNTVIEQDTVELNKE